MLMHRNAWYVGALPHEVGRSPLRRTMLGEQILLYRSEANEVIALEDRCPHRFAPLSRGQLVGDVIRCGYHGLEFDRHGSCVKNPHGDVIAPGCQVKSYPVVERFGLVWLWMGAWDRASQDIIPDLSYMVSPALKTVHSYLHAQYRYDVLVDNLLDLSHGDYLHVGTFAGGQCERSETHVSEASNAVRIVFKQFDAPASPLAALHGHRVDQRFDIFWHPGQVIRFELRVGAAGTDITDAAPIYFCHIATPETDRTTHYFMSVTRDFDLDDSSTDAQMAAQQLATIENEDGPMLLAVSAEMGVQDLLAMRPVVLPTDAGGLRVRRLMKRLVAADTVSGAKS